MIDRPFRTTTPVSYHSFEDLEVWQRARALVREIYRHTEAFADRSLKNQMRRAAVSIPSNIAEGAERNANPEFMHFIGIAKGSAAELRTQVYLATDLGFLPTPAGTALVDETKVLGAKLEALRRSLDHRPSVPRSPRR